MTLTTDIAACRLCADRFAATHTGHSPRPVPWFRSTARVLIAGQAPGMRVHKSGKPFDDPSGDRLRDWLGLTPDQFYDQDKIAIVPMAFCFPGYTTKGADIPPPKLCGQTWHTRVMDHLPNITLRLIIGGAAQRYHLGTTNVTDTIARWRDHLPGTIPLPHPSWRNTAWLNKHPWFATELLPTLRTRVQEALA